VNKTLSKTLLLIAFLALILIFPSLGSVYWNRVFIEIFIWAVVSLGFRLILTAGQLSLAQVSFMGLGAYTVAILTTQVHLNYWISFPLAGIFTGFFALIIGYISLRTRGIHFALATFAISEVIRLIWIEWKTLFGGVGGIPNIPSPSPLLGLKFGSIPSFYYFSFALLFFTALVMYRLSQSRFGMILLTLEKSENLSQSVGVNTFRYKLIAFIAGSFFAGLGGAVHSTFFHYVGPEDFSIHQTFYVLIYVITGGANSIFGTLLGVSSLILGLKLIHNVPNFNPVWEPLFLGGVLLAVMKFKPEGIISLLQNLTGKNGLEREK